MPKHVLLMSLGLRLLYKTLWSFPNHCNSSTHCVWTRDSYIFFKKIGFKMNSLTAVCVLALVTIAAAGSLYTDRYDNINVKEVVSNRKLLLPYVKCLLEEGRCTPEGKELKSHIKEALENYCSKCTEAQRSGTRIVIAHLINEEPEYWNQLTAKYDSTKKYVTKYENELRTVKA